MLRIARAKKKENIVEYLLFMWQMEDLLRGLDFDITRLRHEVLVNLDSEQEREENAAWLGNLAKDMEGEGVRTSGHHHETHELINELALLQQSLLTVLDDKTFQGIYADAKPVLDAFRDKTDRTPRSDVEIALMAMYGVLTLKLAKKEVTSATSEAVDKTKPYLRYLAKAYRQMKAGSLPMNN